MVENQLNTSISLTNEQLEGLDILLSKQFVFVSGVAGSGKTTLVNYYTKYYCDNKKVVKVAYTGMCATNLYKDKEDDIVGTINSVFKINTSGVIKPSIKPDYDLIKQVYSKYDVVIIDEISMVRIDMFEYIIKLLAKANKYRSIPTQIIFVGDFYQLPPIVSDKDKPLLFKYFNTYEGYCFESNYFKQLPLETIFLKANIRSGKDKEFDKYLNNIKEGINLNNTLDYFNKRVKQNLSPKDGVVELYATNKLADKVNRQCLAKIRGKSVTIPAYFDDEVLSAIKSKKLNNKNLPCPLSLRLKPNAQVMFSVNDKIVDNKQRFVNGDLAYVISCSQEEVVVKLHKNNKLVHLHKYNCNYPIFKTNGNRYLGQFKQYPLHLAYAITIHKAQGKTFDEINLDPKSYYDLDSGLIYVALSRVKSISNLNLYSPLLLKHITINKKVVNFVKELDINNIKDSLFK